MNVEIEGKIKEWSNIDWILIVIPKLSDELTSEVNCIFTLYIDRSMTFWPISLEIRGCGIMSALLELESGCDWYNNWQSFVRWCVCNSKGEVWVIIRNIEWWDYNVYGATFIYILPSSKEKETIT